MSDKAVVRNAADAEQVKKGKETEKDRRDREKSDVRANMQTVEGRRMYARFMALCKTFESIYNTHGSTMYYLSGKQDFGHFMFAEVNEAAPKETLLMLQEAGLIPTSDTE